jgi:hypothetical protein
MRTVKELTVVAVRTARDPNSAEIGDGTPGVERMVNIICVTK